METYHSQRLSIAYAVLLAHWMLHFPCDGTIIVLNNLSVQLWTSTMPDCEA